MRKRGAVGKMNGSAVERARGTWSTLPHLASPSISKHPFAVAMQLSALTSMRQPDIGSGREGGREVGV